MIKVGRGSQLTALTRCSSSSAGPAPIVFLHSHVIVYSVPPDCTRKYRTPPPPPPCRRRARSVESRLAKNHFSPGYLCCGPQMLSSRIPRIYWPPPWPTSWGVRVFFQERVTRPESPVTGSGESDREGDRVDPAKGAQDWSNTFRFFRRPPGLVIFIVNDPFRSDLDAFRIRGDTNYRGKG